MPDTKISALPAATTPLAGTEVLPIVQGGATDNVSVANLTAGRSVDAAGLAIDANSATSAVRITQVGAGNALLVEDSASTDATPFVINASGNVVQGYTAAVSTASFTTPIQIHSASATAPVAGYAAFNWADSTAASAYTYFKSRGGTIGTPAATLSGDAIGRTYYYAYDGSNWVTAARVDVLIDGTVAAGDMPGRIVFNVTPAGSTTVSERMRISASGLTGLTGSFGRGAPVTKTGNFTLAATENWVICNGTGSITVTLPTASSWTGREVMIKTIAAQTVVSASSNVVPIDGATAGTAILAATAGKWATLVSNGTNWVIMASN